MSKTLVAAETLSDLAVETKSLGNEMSKLMKMLWNGYESKPAGFDRVAKAYGIGETEQIEKLYDHIGGLIKAVTYMGNLEKLQTYLNVNHSVTVDCTATPAYVKAGKKYDKFKDLYNEYFLESPGTAMESTVKILNSYSALAAEYNAENEKFKEEFNALAETIDQTPKTLKTVTGILTKVKTKDVDVADVISEIEGRITDQQTALEIVSEDK